MASNLNAAVAVTLGLCLGACASLPAPVTSLRDTLDLAAVAEDALALAGTGGVDRLLVVFDIDNTLLAMNQDLGSDQWYEWQEALRSDDPCDENLVNGLLAEQGALFHAAAMRPTQADMAAQVARIQARGIAVIALTSRGPDFRLQTFRELRRAGVSFYASAIGPQRGYPETFIPKGGSRMALYEDGVFLTAGQHKGDMLAALLDRTATPDPAVIVVADDKADNLQAVLDRFAGTATAVHAWHYRGEDQRVAAFDGESAMQQWRTIHPPLLILGDEFGPVHYDISAASRPEGCPP